MPRTLRLTCQGLIYIQIAEQLLISPRTADAHLRAIYGKLGVRSRHEATHFAVEHNLYLLDDAPVDRYLSPARKRKKLIDKG